LGEQFESGTSEVPVTDIMPNRRQPRTHFDEAGLEELAASISKLGVVQPLIVRPLAEGKYELIAGERRLRAAKIAGLATVPVLTRSADNQDSLEIALVENIQREDIGALECARAYRSLIDEFRLTQEQVADKVGKSRTSIANTVRLLRLPKRVQEGLESGRITEGHARALLTFDNEAQQLAIFDQILERGLTVREVEQAAKPKVASVRPSRSSSEVDPNRRALEEAASAHFGFPVRISQSGATGKLTIDFYSDSDLERIIETLGISI